MHTDFNRIDFPLSVSIPETTTETYTAGKWLPTFYVRRRLLHSFLCQGRQADVVKEVGLEPAIKLEKSTGSLCPRSAKSLLVCCFVKVRGCQEWGGILSIEFNIWTWERGLASMPLTYLYHLSSYSTGWFSRFYAPFSRGRDLFPNCWLTEFDACRAYDMNTLTQEIRLGHVLTPSSSQQKSISFLSFLFLAQGCC